MGQVVGESNAKAEVPKSTPITPLDLVATVFHVLGLPQDLHYKDQSGRPVEVAMTEHDLTERNYAERELRRLYARVISAQDTERMRVARELHDGIGQILSGLKFRLEALPARFERLPGAVEREITKASGILDRAIAETRRVSHNLMPAELEGLGLQPALRALCRDFQERTRIPVRMESMRMPRRVDPQTALGVFRIVQEAFNNVGKHARATRVVLALARSGSAIELSVADNGRGFTPARRLRRAQAGGAGLANIRERAEAMGGGAAFAAMT
jgi:two-component system NarL family sensor kinase